MSEKPYVYNPNPPPLPTWKYVVAGGSAGIVEILCMYPLDVAKTRLQLQTTGKAAEGTVQYKGLVDAFSKIISNEGCALSSASSAPLVVSVDIFLYFLAYYAPNEMGPGGGMNLRDTSSTSLDIIVTLPLRLPARAHAILFSFLIILPNFKAFLEG